MARLICPWPRPTDGQRGQALVEFALIVPLFAVIMFALLDFGRVIYTKNTVEEAAREGSRAGTVEAVDAGWKYTLIRNAAINAGAGLGLTTASVVGQGCDDCFYPDGAISGEVVVVTVNTQVQLLTPLLSQLLGGTFNVTSTSRSFIP
jgi:Flp pilus assembly protein TadG